MTGCTFGNNALIFRDIGKTAVTVAKRDGTAIRLVLNPEFEENRMKEYPEAYRLWNKIVVKRENATEEEHEKMMKLFAEISLKELSQPINKVFKITHLKIKVPEYAPIFKSVICSICGEKVMEPKARIKDEKPVCIDCAKEEHYILDGKGISIKREPFTL